MQLNDISQTLPYIYSPNSVIVPYDKVPRKSCQIQVETTYSNFCPVPITVIDRNGIRQSIPNFANPGDNSFKIIKKITVPALKVLEFLTFLKHLPANTRGMLQMLKTHCSKYTPHELSSLNQEMCFYIAISIGYEDLLGRGGSAYHHNTDLVISVKDIVNAPPHPDHRDTLRLGKFREDLQENQSVVGYEVVENDSTPKEYFFHAFGSVSSIRSHRSGSKESGLYVTRYLEGIRYSFHKTMDEAIKEGLIYRTHADAEYGGKPELKHKTAVIELAQQLEVSKLKGTHDKQAIEIEKQRLRLAVDKEVAELQQEQRRRDSAHAYELQQLKFENAQRESRLAEQIADRELQLKTFKMEMERHAAEQARERQHLDHRLYIAKTNLEEKVVTHKTTNEAIKFLPAIITGIVGIAALVGKYLF